MSKHKIILGGQADKVDMQKMRPDAWKIFERKVHETSLCAVLRDNEYLNGEFLQEWGVLYLLESALGWQQVRLVCPMALAIDGFEFFDGRDQLVQKAKLDAAESESVAQDLWDRYSKTLCRCILFLWPKEEAEIQKKMREVMYLIIQLFIKGAEKDIVLEYLVLRYGLAPGGLGPGRNSKEVTQMINRFFDGAKFEAQAAHLFEQEYTQIALRFMAQTFWEGGKLYADWDIHVWDRIASKVRDKLNGTVLSDQSCCLYWDISQLMSSGAGPGDLRIANALEIHGILTVGDLVVYSGNYLSDQVQNFGWKGAAHLNNLLAPMKLWLGMTPRQIAEYKKKLAKESHSRELEAICNENENATKKNQLR